MVSDVDFEFQFALQQQQNPRVFLIVEGKYVNTDCSKGFPVYLRFKTSFQ